MNQELQAVIEKEGNYKQFTHEGFTCFIRRGPMGALNGYVILEQNHKYFGKDYHYIAANANINIHGGLTFAETATATDGSGRQIHIIRFDCAHYGDLMPYSNFRYYDKDELTEQTYKDMNYVTEECKRLAEQMKKVQKE